MVKDRFAGGWARIDAERIFLAHLDADVPFYLPDIHERLLEMTFEDLMKVAAAIAHCDMIEVTIASERDGQYQELVVDYFDSTVVTVGSNRQDIVEEIRCAVEAAGPDPLRSSPNSQEP